MTNEFTAIVEQKGPWFIRYSPEIPGANGQGKTEEEALESLAQAIRLILDDRLELFIDDNMENVEGVRRAGWSAEVCTSTLDLRKIIDRYFPDLPQRI